MSCGTQISIVEGIKTLSWVTDGFLQGVKMDVRIFSNYLNRIPYVVILTNRTVGNNLLFLYLEHLINNNSDVVHAG